MSKSSYTPEFRAKIAQEYLNGNCSRKDLSKKYNIPESTIRDWINVYKTHGINVFINTNENKHYTTKSIPVTYVNLIFDTVKQRQVQKILLLIQLQHIGF